MSTQPRFHFFASDRDTAQAYVLERAHQVLVNGLVVDGGFELFEDDGVEWGCRLRLRQSPDRSLGICLYRGHAPVPGQKFQIMYVYKQFRESLSKLPIIDRMRDYPIVMCRGENDVPWGYHPITYANCTEYPKQLRWPEYETVADFYEGRRATRSGVPYMHHIDEGLAVLARIGSNETAMRAFCLHPLFQAHADLEHTLWNLPYRLIGELRDTEARSMLIAVEYRAWANRTLSGRVGELRGPEDIPLPTLPEVRHMLIADKVQNYKDFLLYHAQTHPRRLELDRYFRLWLEALGVTPEAFAEHSEAIQVPRTPVPG